MAIQITREFMRLGKYLPDIVIKTVFGGVPLRKSMADIQSGCDILVGTAGRIADLVRHKALDTSQLKFFVVDECDRQIETLCFLFFSLLTRSDARRYPGSVQKRASGQAGVNVHGDPL